MIKGEVWLVRLDPTEGAEMRKTRPTIIVKENFVGKLELRVIVPVTEWKEIYADAEWKVRLVPDGQNGLSKISAADVFQVRSLSKSRFMHRLGKLSESDMLTIAKSLAFVFGIEPEMLDESF